MVQNTCERDRLHIGQVTVLTPVSDKGYGSVRDASKAKCERTFLGLP